MVLEKPHLYHCNSWLAAPDPRQGGSHRCPRGRGILEARPWARFALHPAPPWRGSSTTPHTAQRLLCAPVLQPPFRFPAPALRPSLFTAPLCMAFRVFFLHPIPIPFPPPRRALPCAPVQYAPRRCVCAIARGAVRAVDAVRYLSHITWATGPSDVYICPGRPPPRTATRSPPPLLFLGCRETWSRPDAVYTLYHTPWPGRGCLSGRCSAPPQCGPPPVETPRPPLISGVAHRASLPTPFYSIRDA
jgi:hypothetical protein